MDGVRVDHALRRGATARSGKYGTVMKQYRNRFSLTPTKVEKMFKSTKAWSAAIFVAAIAAGAPQMVSGDGYQYIVSGDPVAAAAVDSSVSVSPGASLETGVLTAKTPAGSLEARYRTWDESDGEALRSDKALAFIIVIR